MIYHPHVVQSIITNDYITVHFDDGNGRVKTEIRHKVLLQVSLYELHIYMQKKDATIFPWHMTKKDFYVLVFLPFN